MATLALSLAAQNVEDVYPLSPLQQGMLFHTLLHGDSGVYLMQDRYRIGGRVDHDAFLRAWQLVVAAHPALRTSFVWKTQKQPMQVVHKEVDVPVEFVDLRDRSPEEQAAYVRELLAEEQRQGFNLTRAPLIRFRLVRLDETAYEFIRSFHHVLMDAWCISLVTMDFVGAYEALCQGRPPVLRQPRPYRDYIRWLQQQDKDAARRFWQQQLRGLDAPTPLVIDQAPRANYYTSAVLVDDRITWLDLDQTQAVQRFCRQQGITPNTLFQGVWALLLSRYSGSRDVLFGVTVSGRPPNLAGVEEMIGLFINTLPLRVTLPTDEPLLSWLHRLQAQNLDLREFEHTPLVDIQGWSNLPRGEPLFDSILVYENAPIDEKILRGDFSFRLEGMDHSVHTHYGLTVVILPGERLGIRVSYDRNRFEAAAIERLLGHLAQLLSAMLDHSEACLDDFEPLTPAERRQLLVEWNRTAEDFPLDKSYAELFAEQAAAHPERVVVTCGGEQLTYAELDARANRLAQALVTAGATSDTVVALLAARGPALITMMIATLKAGAAFLPLEIDHPPARLRALLHQSQAPLLVTTEEGRRLARTLMGKGPTALLVAEAHWTQGEATCPSVPRSAGDLAYVLFTSGSTGSPKGVLIEQAGLLNNIFGKVPTLGLGECDRIAQTASVAFDVAVWQCLGAPLVGATVHVTPPAIAQNPQELLEAVEDEGITLLEVVPSLLQAMLSVCPAHLKLERLRWLIPTGEALSPALARAWFERFPHVPLMNAYGPAECADDVAFHALTEAPPEDCRHLPIGRPTANNEIFLLDAQMRPVPVGVPGEICIGGVGVGRGYLNDPGKTRAAFVPHPFRPGERLYRSGDSGRYRPDGLIEYLGRKDQQVKLRGQRIELGEIEALLLKQPLIAQAAVVLRTDLATPQLVAYVVAKAPLDVAAPSKVLRAQLPPAMVPARFVFLDALPLNANGKLDRKALPKPDTAAEEDRFVAPRTATETQLAAIWAEVLALPQIGVETSFFELGGHSLLATQVISRIRSVFKRELPLRAVFEHPTVAALARVIDRQPAPQALPSRPPLAPQPRPDKLPLSFAQQRLWFLEQFNPGSSAFNIPFALKLEGKLDVDALRRSFEALLARHEVLCTAFTSENGEPRQVIVPGVGFELPLADLTALDPDGRQASVQGELAQFFEAPFDLTRPPLLRACIWRLGPQQYLLGVALHHLISDAWSATLAIRELAECYQALFYGRPVSLPALPIQYADFALWQRRYLQGPVLERELAYWRQMLGPRDGEAPRYLLNLATDQPRPAVQSYRAGSLIHRLPQDLSEGLHRFAAEQGLSGFAVVFAGFAVLLHRLSAQTDVFIGTPVSNRQQVETENLLGILLNNLVIRSRLDDTLDFAGFARQIGNALFDAQAHQDLPFEQLVNSLALPRSLAHAPLFQVMVAQQLTVESRIRFPELRFEVLDTHLTHSECDLDLHVACPPSAPIELELLYALDLFHPQTAARLLARLEHCLTTLVARPKTPIVTLPQIGIDRNQTANRKMDLQAPPAPATGKPLAPRTDTERRLAAIWCEVLQLDAVSVEDNFFALGGHSLLITQVMARVRAQFAVELRLRILFDHPTVAALAEQIDKAARQGVASLAAGGRPQRLPLSYAQQRLWFLSQLEPDGTQYNMPFAIRFTGELDAGALAQAFGDVVARHEILRSRVTVTGAEPALVISSEPPVLAIEAIAGRRWESAQAAAIEQEGRQPFDLATQAPIRARLLRHPSKKSLLLLTLHHSVADDWSIRILLEELAAAYQARRHGQAPALPPLAAQYVDYSLWQRRPEQQRRDDRELAYWERTLGRGDYRLQLPTDFAPSQARDDRAEHYEIVLPDPLYRAVQDFARPHQVTPFIVHMAVLHLLLRRYSGQEDIRVGTPVAGRHHPDTHGLIGCFVNTLVIRSQLADETALTFDSLVRRIGQTVIEAQEHQDVPFERVVEKLVEERDLDRSPLFQVMLSMEHTRLQPWPDLALEEVAMPATDAQFDLSFDLNDSGEGASLRVSYRRALFRGARMQRLLEHWLHLLQQGLANPEARLAAFTLVTPTERQRLLDFNRSAHDFPLHLGFGELFDRQTEKDPDRVVAGCAGQTLSHAELVQRSQRLARAFEAAGLFDGHGEEPLVALLGERGLPFLAALVSTLSSGAAYLPLDPNLPDGRLAELLALGQPPLLVTTAACRDRALAAGQGCPVLVIEEHWLTGAAAPLKRRGSPESLAYVLFTSGSTGTPKGVMVEQRGMLNNIFGKQPTLGLDKDDVIAQTASQAFDISVWQLLAGPVTGARVEILPDAVAHDPARLLAAIDDYGITLLEAVPAVIRALLDAAADHPTRLPSLRWLLATGENLPAQLANDWLARFPAIPMMNAYGPAECADDVAFHPITTPLNLSLPVPIGRPTANNELLILDPAGRLQPPGIAGEIGIGGVGVGRGYWRDEKGTREAFVDHPLGSGARFYRSGDLGRWREDGTIEFLGRRDFQIKVRGHRIEPGEIESRLEQHPQVKRAAVVAPENRRGERQLVGYWTRRGGDIQPAELGAWLAARIPAYMVPSLLPELPEMPLNRNGKIDRQALIARPLEEVARQRRAPSSPTEVRLAALWRQVLTGVGEISAEDNFFALGGHSLLVTRLVALIRDRWGVVLPLRSLFEHPTLAALAALIDGGHAGATPGPSLGRDPRPDRLPLSFEQRRLWLLSQLEPDSSQYNVPFALKLSGPLDGDALQEAFERLAQRHEILRSRIQVQDETPYLVIDAASPRLQVTILGDDDWEDGVRAALQTQACKPFDLARDPPLRVQLLRREHRQEAVLIITQHHVVTDDWSVQILLDELAECYAAARERRPAALPPLPLQYVDYSLWQQAPEQQRHFAAQLDYWRETLGEAPYMLDLPMDHPPAAGAALEAGPALEAGEHRITLPISLTNSLRAYAGQRGSTVFVVMMAALHVLLARYCNQPDVRVGTPVAGRRQLETQGLLGCFVNTLVVDSRVDDDASFDRLVTHLQQRVLAAQEHQDVPFERVVDALVKDRDFNRSPLFQVMLSMENSRADESRWPGLGLSEIAMPATAAQFPQSWEAYDDGESLTVKLCYDRTLFEDAGMARWLRHWQKLLETVLAAPQRPLAQLDWLPDAERRRLLVDFNRSQQTFALEQGYAGHFARQVQVHGQQPLASCGADTLSYAELDRRANRLARVFSETLPPGGNENLVALLGERDLALLAAMVATFKANAAYVPLDPNLPAARLGELLALSGAPVLAASRACRDAARQLAAEHACSVLIVEDHWLQGEAAPLPAAGSADRLAYVLFTSGSTGTPKGVMVEQRGMLNNIFGKQPGLGLGQGDVIAQTASQAFDVSVWQFLAAPLVGAQVRILPDAIAHDPARLLDAIDRYGVTLLEAVPSMIQGLLDAAGDTTLPSLRWLIATGEALPPALANRWLKRFPAIPLMNAYGPAECSDDVAFHAITAGELSADRPVPVGRPTANNQLYVLDAALRPQPVGVPGEICIGGVGVGRGYWRDEARTRQAFIDHPFEPGARFYRSGDLGRWLADGTIEYLGRRDFQIKLRGHRIEPGEIENRLMALPQVSAAVVTAPRNERGVRQLVAYWVAAGADASDDTLRDALMKQLPGYMVPDIFMRLEALPLNANGKVDRQALPRPTLPAREAMAASEGNEATLCELIESLLDVKDVRANDNFFALGGDSIMALQLISRARQRGITLTPKLIFQQRSIRDLARAAGSLGPVETEQDLLTGDAPLTPVQHWFFEQGFENPNHWNQALLWQPQGRLDATATEQALRHLVCHHDALRLRFTETAGGWRQSYGPPENAFRFVFVTGDGVAPQALAEALAPLAADLDIQQGPISQAALVTLSDGRQRLYWVIHHLVIDTVSWHLLQDDFATVYGQIVEGRPAQLPPKTSSYRQWADHWRSAATQARLAQQRDWWLQQDVDFTLPVAHPDAPHRIGDAETLTAILDEQRTEQFLKQAQEAYRTRPEELLLAALAVTLSRWSGQSSVRLDLEHHGRTRGGERLDVSRTVGWFAAIYPIKLDVPQPSEPGQTLCAVKEQLRGVPDHGVGYGALRYLAEGEQALPGRHRSRVSFEYFGVTRQGDEAGEPLPPERASSNRCEYELDVTAQVVDGRLRLEWTYGCLRDPRETQQRHLDDFVARVQALIDHCLEPDAGRLTPADFPMAKNLTQDTLNTLLQRFGSAANARNS